MDAFLPCGYCPEHILLDPRRPMAVDPLTNGDLLTDYRRKHLEAQQAALGVWDEIDAEFCARFGRTWHGAVETYGISETTRAAVVTLGSMTGAAREAVDRQQAAGRSVGLIKLRMVRPFPRAAVRAATAGLRAIGVVDRNVSFGWNTGILFQEVSAAAFGQDLVRLPFIAGLGGQDITVEMFERALSTVDDAARRKPRDPGRCEPTVWLRLEGEEVKR